MGNHIANTREPGFIVNQDRTEDFVFTQNNNLSVPSLNNSLANNQIQPPIDQPIIWDQQPIFNNQNIEPTPNR